MHQKIHHKGHLWKTIDDYPTPDKNDPKVDTCAYTHNDTHTGPVCTACGLAFCMHCHPEEFDTECDVGYYTCGVCDTIIKKDTQFCPGCGAKLSAVKTDYLCTAGPPAVRDAQLYTGSPNDPDMTYQNWTDIKDPELILGIYKSDCEQNAIAQAALENHVDPDYIKAYQIAGRKPC